MTTGPSDPNILTVSLRARDKKGDGRCSPIQPKKPSGQISLLVLSTKDFDATQIDLGSIVFGPAYASPVISKPSPIGHGEKISSDPQVDWEESLKSVRPELMDRKGVKFKNLLLTFNVADLDVQCNLDRALFLRGKTNSGQSIVGAIKAEIVGCKDKETGTHRYHRTPFKWWKTKQK
ncbi:MAG: hypothetical protein H7301_05415 [Cryobacterium sp.]|nr:hypothetical protein [Oligoflexia bacterium]